MTDVEARVRMLIAELAQQMTATAELSVGQHYEDVVPCLGPLDGYDGTTRLVISTTFAPDATIDFARLAEQARSWLAERGFDTRLQRAPDLPGPIVRANGAELEIALEYDLGDGSTPPSVFLVGSTGCS